MKNINISKVLTTLLVSSFCSVTAFSANPSSFTVEDSLPKIIFDDTRTVDNDGELSIWGHSTYHGMWLYHSLDNRYLLRYFHQVSSDTDIMDLGGTSNMTFVLRNNGVENQNIFNSGADGDISLADGSVFIDKSANRMGIGTTTPTKGLEISSSAPTLKLTDTAGTAWYINKSADSYTFDIAHTNDATDDDSNTTSPFTIYKSAKQNTLYLTGNGVGIGTSAPQNKLYVTDTINKNTELVELMALSIENTNASGYSDTGFMLENRKEDVRWTFRTLEEDALVSTKNSFAISKKASGDKELIITGHDEAGGMRLVLSNGAHCTNGVWENRSTRASKENIKVLSSQDAMAAFHKLQPMTYNYKNDKKESYVGFIAEDVPDLVATNSRKSLSPMDMVAVLTKVLQEQDKILAETRAETRAEIKVMKEEIAELKIIKQKVAQLESLLTNLALDTSNKTTEKVSLNK